MRKREQLETFNRPIYGADPDSLRRQPSAASVRRARNACMAHFYSGPLKIVSASAPGREWVSLIRRIINFLFRSRSHALWQAQGLPFDTNRHRGRRALRPLCTRSLIAAVRACRQAYARQRIAEQPFRKANLSERAH